MRKVEENKLIKKQKLMSTAFDLFTTKGIVRTSISDIVQESGVAKGTFYLYFQDKYDLQEKLIIHTAEQLFHHAMEKSGYQYLDSVQDKVIAIIDDILNQLNKDKRLLRFINKNLSWGVFSHALGNMESVYFNFFSNLLGIQDGKRVSILIYMIVELVGSTSYSVILNDDPVSLNEFRPFLERSVRLILDSFLEEEKSSGTEQAE